MNGFRKLPAAAILLGALLCNAGGTAAQPFGMAGGQVQQKPQPQVLGSPTGRFVFGQISDSSKDQFMLDTLTGRLWRIAESGQIGIYLTPVPYRDAEGKCVPLPPAAAPCGPGGSEEKPGQNDPGAAGNAAAAPGG